MNIEAPDSAEQPYLLRVKQLLDGQSSWFVRFLLSGSAFGIAVAIQGQDGDLLLLVPAVVLAAWLCGLWGGLAATGLACAAAYGGAATPPIGGVALLAMCGIMISALGAALSRATAHDERDFSDAMIESMPGVTYFYTEQGRYLRWNRNLERATGYSAEELARLRPHDMVADEDKARVQAEIAKVFEDSESSVEAGLLGKDGSSTPYYFTGRRVVFRGESCLVGVGIDLSRANEAASRLRRTESRLAQAQRIAHVGSWELEVASGALAWSDEVFRIFGVAPGAEAVTFESFLSHVHASDREAVQHAQNAALSGEACLDMEHRIQRADGEVRWVHELAELQFDGLGQAIALNGTVRDITDRKLAQLQLHEAMITLEQTVEERTEQLKAALGQAEAADQVKSAFLATMSHELRTPLNSIIGFTGILLQSLAGPLNPEQKKQLGMVRGSARHLLDLINDVLDISKIEARQLQVNAEPFDLEPLLERVVAALTPQASAKGLALVSRVPHGPLEMVGDRRRVEQVVINLLGNAIKFTERGEVTLTAEIRAGASPTLGSAGLVPLMVLRVADTGIGMTQDDLKKVFLPFHQIDTGLTRTHEGTGLGLAICSRLVALMGGTITALSVPGAGSTFTVSLPCTGATRT